MGLKELITDLENAAGPDRELDAAIYDIAERLRKRQSTASLPRPEVSKIPHYTRLVDHAYEFAQVVAPSHVGGCSWEDEKGSARINNGPYCKAVSPAIALCIAAMIEIGRKD